LFNLLREHNLRAFPSVQAGAEVHACLLTFIGVVTLNINFHPVRRIRKPRGKHPERVCMCWYLIRHEQL